MTVTNNKAKKKFKSKVDLNEKINFKIKKSYVSTQ